MPSDETVEISFPSLNLLPAVEAAVTESGYSTPTPIQAQVIPHLLEGRDVLGQADTGTGKTAAFALPLLSMVDPKSRITQVLVLTPTRELAIQVANAIASYGRKLGGLNVQAIYGGAPYSQQIRELKRGVQIVVGTPGRVMDHMRRGGLDLSNLACLVLDEADEMLRMGFVDDVTWILEQTPAERQFALFSATMPDPIRKIADKHLKTPAVVTVRQKHKSDASINARYLITSWKEKSSALFRVLETEETDAVIVFTKTREATVRVADELLGRGYAAVAINGDIPQKQREQAIQQLRNGKLKILVATDVAARGLDVPRISHVINYDLPMDNQTWVHRIGRTGRAGRSGEAILFISWNEKRYLKGLERESRQRITEMQFPTNSDINAKRKQVFRQRVTDAMGSESATVFKPLIEEIMQQSGASAEDIAVAVAVAMHGDKPFLLSEEMPRRKQKSDRRDTATTRNEHPFREPPHGREHSREHSREHNGNDGPRREQRPGHRKEAGMERFRVEVGHEHGVQPGNIVGAIANEAGLDSKNIGRIDICDDHSFVDLPEGMPKQIFRGLKDVVVLGRHLRITRTVPMAGRRSHLPRDAQRPPRNRRHDKKGPRRFDRHKSPAAPSEHA
jgi:ATP-dependent RNA helicase DeaD